VLSKCKKFIRSLLDGPNVIRKNYDRRFRKYSFVGKKCRHPKQMEALITKLYHSIEKGLSYEDFRPGFGAETLDQLLCLMEEYAQRFDVTAFFYETALSVLQGYVEKNLQYGWEDPQLNERICKLPGTANQAGGVLSVCYRDARGMDYKQFVESRHSVRSFGEDPVDIEKVKRAVEMAQHTPSACNRQGWCAWIVRDSDKIRKILKNQNGNRGFGHKIPLLLAVTADIRCFNRSREMYQPFIDGGMYAMSLLNALHYEGLATVPLSASLSPSQEKGIRSILQLDEAEVPILLIGVGNYPKEALTTRSERKPARITIV